MLRWIRLLGWVLLLGGCVYQAFFFLNISMFTYEQWHWYINGIGTPLPDTENITRDTVIGVLRDFQLSMKDLVHNNVLWPTVAMFFGGIFLSLREKTHCSSKNDDIHPSRC